MATIVEPGTAKANARVTGAASGTDDLPPLSNDEIQRYSRHLILPDVESTGQRKLKKARVLLIGAGGLGSPTALYLAAAGVGTLGLVDFDVVDVTNLQRQIIHGTKDIGRPKIASAKDRIADVNPHVHVEAFETPFTSANALEIAKDFDIIVDGTDNFATRYLTNDTAVLLGKPNVYGSIFRFEGQASVFATENGPCYRCLFREPPPPGLVPSCAEGGVLGVLPGLIGTIQATETIKLILGAGENLIGRLLLVDTLSMQFRTVKVHKDPTCPACGTHEIKELIDYEEFCGIPQAAAAEPTIEDITPRALQERLQRGDNIDLVDVREPFEWELGYIKGARLVPLNTVKDSLSTFDKSREIALYCKGGVRSRKAAAVLLDAGFTRVLNVEGGILRWADEVDPTLPKY